jgi:hypothetical protein
VGRSFGFSISLSGFAEKDGRGHALCMQIFFFQKGYSDEEATWLGSVSCQRRPALDGKS